MSKHVVNLKVEIIKAYGVVCMTEVLKSRYLLFQFEFCSSGAQGLVTS